MHISEDKETVVHYAASTPADPRHHFSFFKTKDFERIEFELPEGAKPVGVLNDARVVCELSKMVAVFDVNAQKQQYENLISSLLSGF